MSKKPELEMETKLGKIMIKKSGFTAEGYPGFVFSIERNGSVVDIALLEVDENTFDDMPEPMLKVHVWGPGHEEPVFDHYLSAKKIDQMIEEEK